MKKMSGAMKQLVLLAIGLIVASSASAQGKEIGKFKPNKDWTCRDYIALDASYQPKAVYWASGQGRFRGDDVMDIDAVEQVIPVLTESCKKNPTAVFRDKLKAAWDDVKAKVDPHKAHPKK